MADNSVKHLALALSLDDASAMADNALRLGNDNDMPPLTVAVLDAGDNLLVFKREDGAGILRGDIAIGKAWGALGMGLSSRTINDRLAARPIFLGALAAAAQGRFVPVPGGVLIIGDTGAVIGAVGISGDTSENDEYCAVYGIKEAGFNSDPEVASLA